MSEPLPELTPQEQQFVEEYCKDRNAVRAALAAGLRASYFPAATAAKELLKKPQIRKAVTHVLRVQAKRLKTEVPDIVREWAILGKSDIDDYEVDADGRLTTRPGVPRAALRAVKKVKQTRTERLTGRGDAQTLTVETKTEIELHAKEGPLQSLNEHLHGVLPGTPASAPEGIPIEHAIEFAEFLAAKRAREKVSGVVPTDVSVVPETGTAGGSVPESGG